MKKGFSSKYKKIELCCKIMEDIFIPNTQYQDAESFGWKLEDGHYTLHWFDGEAAPKIVDVAEQVLCCQHIIVLLLYLKRL